MLLALTLSGAMLVPAAVGSQSLEDQVNAQLGAGADAAEFQGAADPRSVAARIVNVLLGVLGIIFFILIIMGGYWFLTAAGEEEKVQKGRKTILRAVVGLIVVMMAYAISNFVGGAVTEEFYQ